MNAIQTQVQSILVENGLDFEIQKVPLFAFGKDFQTIETNYFGLLNTKTGEVINSVKQGYTISQNSEVVEMVLRGIEPFSDKLDVTFGGSLNGGRKVYLQLKVEGKAKVGNDTLTQYVTIIDSNDGSTSLSIGIGDLCMRCQNQFFKFYKAGNAKFRHTATIEQRIKEIPMLIEIALNESLKQIELYNKFVSTPVTRSLANQMVKSILGYDREFTSMDELAKKSTKAINILDAINNDIETEFNQVGLNAWALLGGITRYTTHTQSVPKRDNARNESLMSGGGYKMNQKALEFVTKLVGAN
jgi:phage/plasmid-like protein (TIGR03299 family)